MTAILCAIAALSGAFLGIFVTALCVAASRGDEFVGENMDGVER